MAAEGLDDLIVHDSLGTDQRHVIRTSLDDRNLDDRRRFFGARSLDGLVVGSDCRVGDGDGIAVGFAVAGLRDRCHGFCDRARLGGHVNEEHGGGSHDGRHHSRPHDDSGGGIVAHGQHHDDGGEQPTCEEEEQDCWHPHRCGCHHDGEPGDATKSAVKRPLVVVDAPFDEQRPGGEKHDRSDVNRPGKVLHRYSLHSRFG